MPNADGYRNGKFMSATTVTAGRYDVFELDENGSPKRHFGTFCAGRPRSGQQANGEIIAVVDHLAATTWLWTALRQLHDKGRPSYAGGGSAV